MRFYVISLGAGHPEQITVQALKALQDCEKIFVPARGNGWEGSVAYRILKGVSETCNIVFEEKLLSVHTPMSYSQQAWLKQVEAIAEAFNKYQKIGFVTLGDAGLYSSAYYLLDIIKEKYPHIYENTEVIPGISSISYASAKVKKPLCLGNTKLEVIPTHVKDIKITRAYMRLHKGDYTGHLQGENTYTFENLGFENETIKKGTPDIIENYLTVIIDFPENNLPSELKE